jgi:hypothetical protein
MQKHKKLVEWIKEIVDWGARVYDTCALQVLQFTFSGGFESHSTRPATWTISLFTIHTPSMPTGYAAQIICQLTKNDTVEKGHLTHSDFHLAFILVSRYHAIQIRDSCGYATGSDKGGTPFRSRLPGNSQSAGRTLGKATFVYKLLRYKHLGRDQVHCLVEN